MVALDQDIQLLQVKKPRLHIYKQLQLYGINSFYNHIYLIYYCQTDNVYDQINKQNRTKQKIKTKQKKTTK